MKDAIELTWLKHYVGQLLEYADKISDGPMKTAVLLRADNVLDMVKAWKETHDA